MFHQTTSNASSYATEYALRDNTLAPATEDEDEVQGMEL